MSIKAVVELTVMGHLRLIIFEIMNEQVRTSKNISASLILGWIFGSFFAFIGVISVFTEPIPGLAMLAMVSILLPPVTNFIEQKLKFTFSRGVKVIIIFFCLIIVGATADTSNIDNVQSNQLQQEQEEKQVILDVAPQEDEKAWDEAESKTITDEQAETVQKGELKPAQEKISTEPQVNSDEISTDTEEEDEPVLFESETVSQKNAVRKAKAYLNYSAFSYTGLIEQLEFEQFSHADAIYGVDRSGADWFKQAAKSAEAYMNYSAFSRGRLIDQLKFVGFTQAQAEHGANMVGL